MIRNTSTSVEDGHDALMLVDN